jgi:arginine utilization protein RocB
MSNIVKAGIEYFPSKHPKPQAMFLSLPRNLPRKRKRAIDLVHCKIIPFPRMQTNPRKLTQDQLLTRLRHSDSVDMEKVMKAAKRFKKLKVNHANTKIVDWNQRDALRFDH